MLFVAKVLTFRRLDV